MDKYRYDIDTRVNDLNLRLQDYWIAESNDIDDDILYFTHVVSNDDCQEVIAIRNPGEDTGLET